MNCSVTSLLLTLTKLSCIKFSKYTIMTDGSVLFMVAALNSRMS